MIDTNKMAQDLENSKIMPVLDALHSIIKLCEDQQKVLAEILAKDVGIKKEILISIIKGLNEATE